MLLYLQMHRFLLRPGEYCDKHVCLWACVSVCLSVCLSVSLSVRLHISCTTCLNFQKFYASVLFWRRCNTLCTSAYVDDAMRSHNGPRQDAAKYTQTHSSEAAQDRWRSLISTIVLFTALSMCNAYVYQGVCHEPVSVCHKLVIGLCQCPTG